MGASMRPFSSRRLVSVVGLVALMALSARVSVPMLPVPMTMQSWAVLLSGAALGGRVGALSVALYLALAALGAPVLASGAHGLAPFRGATAGYLYAFVPVAWLAGRVPLQRWSHAIMGMTALHALLLALGAAWLAARVGWPRAYSLGVAPFLAGAVVKSVLAAVAARALSARVSQY